MWFVDRRHIYDTNMCNISYVPILAQLFSKSRGNLAEISLGPFPDLAHLSVSGYIGSDK